MGIAYPPPLMTDPSPTSRAGRRRRAAWLLLALTMGMAGSRAPGVAEEPPPVPRAPLPPATGTSPNSVLLLRNGRALEGRIARAGDYYYVALAGGEIRIGADQVEFWCTDLEDGYRRKRAAVRPGSVEEHLRLAHWCLRQGLYDHARAELAEARRVEPEHPMIELLGRQLTAAQSPAAPRPGPVALSAAAGHQKPQNGPTPRELDAMVEDLPREAVETFTRTIQPLLINTCGSARCHGPGTKSEFRLRRIPLGRPATRLTTQRNLHAVLQWIDRSHPASSALLTGPDEPHGPTNAPVFSKFQTAQYRLLADWVGHVTGSQVPHAAAAQVAAAGEPPNAAAAGGDVQAPGNAVPVHAAAAAAAVPTVPNLLDQPAGALPLAPTGVSPGDDPAVLAGEAAPGEAGPGEAGPGEAGPGEAGKPGELETVPAGYEEPVLESGPSDAESPAPESEPPRRRVQRGAEIEGFVPKDPFDPDIFNRRYFR